MSELMAGAGPEPAYHGPGALLEDALVQVKRVIVGQDRLVERALLCLLARGHCLIEGVPGLAKTLTVSTLARVVGGAFSRLQFTPDLVPADIVGTRIWRPSREEFDIEWGPVFANIVLADEINRATPKTQSAMLEAMQEHSVTVAGTMHVLREPFFVLATQNPIEMEGTYPLPEAQLDRFLFKIMVPSPTLAELATIVDRTTGTKHPDIGNVLGGPEILRMRELARAVPIAPHVRDYAAALVLATHPASQGAPDITQQFVRFGSSPRGAQAVVLAAKIKALLAGRYNVALEDINTVAVPALRHRVLLNFEGEAEGIRTEDVVARIIEHVGALQRTALKV